MFEFLKFLCYITVHLKLYSFVKIDHGGRQNRKNKTKFFSFHFSIHCKYISQLSLKNKSICFNLMTSQIKSYRLIFLINMTSNISQID